MYPKSGKLYNSIFAKGLEMYSQKII